MGRQNRQLTGFTTGLPTVYEVGWKLKGLRLVSLDAEVESVWSLCAVRGLKTVLAGVIGVRCPLTLTLPLPLPLPLYVEESEPKERGGNVPDSGDRASALYLKPFPFAVAA